MAAGRMNKVLIAVSLASIAVTVIGLALGYHFMALFLFFPGIFGLGMTRGSDATPRHEGGYCPECGSPVTPDDSFCRVCGRRMKF